MVSLMSKGFFVLLFILPDVIFGDETESSLYIEDAEGNRFYTGFLPGGERLAEKQMMKSGQQLLPESFDAREKWPECKNIIGLIRDQKHCGSCWAFSVAEVISDRICIQSKGDKQVVISPEDLMTCCKDDRCKGCKGGDPAFAFKYWKKNGIVTGGDFNSHEGCRPYTIPDGWDDRNTPSCNKTCEKGYPIAYEADKHYGLRPYAISSDVKQIQQEIYQNGPVSAGFRIYRDFGKKAQSGVYSHANEPTNQGHAIKIIGWGEEDGTPYWLCANSWNVGWGDKGYFKMLRGDPENNCGIETYIHAGTAKL